MKKITAAAVILLAVCGLVAWPAVMEACVGKTLYLGRLPGQRQEILSELFVWLVTERTGTTIEVKSFSNSRSSHSALEEAEIDVYLEETLVALTDILGRADSPDDDTAARQLVRAQYAERFNLVWLEPWGPEGSVGKGSGASKVAPVVRKDTLKKFPALSRLVNKMAGVVDDAAMERLLEESSREPVRDVTKRFLKQKKLI
jgi:osmoprotectant transport system substrate-binding protein